MNSDPVRKGAIGTLRFHRFWITPGKVVPSGSQEVSGVRGADDDSGAGCERLRHRLIVVRLEFHGQPNDGTGQRVGFVHGIDLKEWQIGVHDLNS